MPDPANESAHPHPANTAETTGPTILVVEDDPLLRTTLERLLRRWGYDVISAAGGHEALRCVKQGKIALIVTDLCMPQMDGIELVMHLRGAGRGIPVIAISGALLGYTSEMLRAVRLLGARITLEKPFQPSRLIEAVRELLGGPDCPAAS